MVYRKIPMQKITSREGDCVIHVPANYGGTALLTEIQDAAAKVDPEPEKNGAITANAENEPITAIAENPKTNAENTREAADEAEIKDEKKSMIRNEQQPGFLQEIMDGFNLSFEDLLLIGLILLIANDGDKSNDDLILILAFLLLSR